jgi:hypothetical protein
MPSVDRRLEVEVKGRLAALMRGTPFPERIVGTRVVAEVRYRRLPRPTNECLRCDCGSSARCKPPRAVRLADAGRHDFVK